MVILSSHWLIDRWQIWHFVSIEPVAQDGIH